MANNDHLFGSKLTVEENDQESLNTKSILTYDPCSQYLCSRVMSETHALSSQEHKAICCYTTSPLRDKLYRVEIT